MAVGKTSVKSKPPSAPDLSMLDDADVANLVLQRSEVGQAGQAPGSTRAEPAPDQK